MTDQAFEAPMVGERKKLFFCVGKMTYMRNSPRLLHFMPLKDFFVNDSVEFTHLLFLRALRTGTHADLAVFGDAELERYMRGTSVQVIAEAAADILFSSGEGANDALTVAEVSSGVGVTFEYLKLLCHRRARSDQTSACLNYAALGAAEHKLKFEVLHADDGAVHGFHYTDVRDEVDWRRALQPDLLILNVDRSIREDDAPSVAWEDYLAATKSPVLCAIRVVKGASDEERTTIKGRRVLLPSSDRVLRLFRDHSAFWHYRILTGFDAKFFLPEPGREECDLLIAYTAGLPLPRKNFAALIPQT